MMKVIYERRVNQISLKLNPTGHYRLLPNSVDLFVSNASYHKHFSPNSVILHLAYIINRACQVTHSASQVSKKEKPPRQAVLSLVG